jgi:hypothetical protein
MRTLPFVIGVVAVCSPSAGRRPDWSPRPSKSPASSGGSGIKVKVD